MGGTERNRLDSVSSEDGLTISKFTVAGFDYELPKGTSNNIGEDGDAILSRQKFRPFSADQLAAAFPCGCSAQAIKDYPQAYTRDTVTRELGTLFRQHHLITYAIERHSAECVQTLIEYGASPKAKDFGDVPVLAFAIMRTKWTVRNATDVVKTLLANGADYRCIPANMWREYIKTPKAETDHKPSEPSLITRTKWCTPERRAILADTLNLTMRYYPWRASRFDPHMKRTLQIAAAHRMTEFLKMPFQIIGQEPTTLLIMQNIYAHIALNVKKPLVLGFAGLSGHGKTELATQMGKLLSVPLRDIDCAQMGQIESLLGSSLRYIGCEKGSPLNNFLTENTGSRCVVFLDEFDETEQCVREALLKAMDTGMYRDRRTNNEVDASNVIWILATNLGDTAINRFHSKHIANRKDADIDKISIEPLREELFKLFFNVFSPAITGRINAIAPFFPFSPNEQAVVAHKFVLSLQKDARRPIDMEEPQLRYVGHSHIHVVDDGKVCQHLAKTGYVKELGARSISNAVSSLQRDYVWAYSKEGDEVTEALNSKPLLKFTVQVHPVSETGDKISVFRDGFTALPGTKSGGR